MNTYDNILGTGGGLEVAVARGGWKTKGDVGDYEILSRVDKSR
jgi:hypothetical protein